MSRRTRIMLIQPLTPEILEKRRNFRRKILGVPVRVWRKTRRFAFWSLAIGFVLHSALNIYASTLLNQELSAIRQKGEPLQFSELAPPAVPDSQNAALVYKAAFDSILFSDEQKGSFRTRESNWSAQQGRWIEAAVAKNQKAIGLARRAAAMPKCVFPLAYNTKNSSGLLFPHYLEMRELARLLSAQAQVEAQKGDIDRALRDVRAVLAMANHLSNEPVLIGFLVAQAVDGIAYQALARILQTTQISLAQAETFKKSLPPTDWNRAFKRCLTGERVWSIDAFELVRRTRKGNFLADLGVDSAPFWASYPLTLLWRPVSKLDQVQTLRLWKQHFVSASAPAFSPQALFNDQILEDAPKYAILTRLWMPVFSRASINRDRAEVRSLQREIALALAVYRGQNGAYPARLEQLKPALPFDPYNKKPMVYRREKNGFLLYSVGPNREDESGGNAQFQLPSGSWTASDDIVWGAPKR